jgi:8-oxo-dGTP pyrophosphatase MutT (NUDIX family)
MNFRLAVKAFIVDGQKLLLLKRRSDDPHKPGTWDIPGGRLELGEDPFVGLAREVDEETGMQVSVDAPVDIHHFVRDDGQAITMLIFLCTLPAGREVKLSEEHTEYAWHDLADAAGIPAWLTPVVEKYQKHFQEEA